LLPSRCGYTRATYNPTRRGFLLGLRRDSEFRDFFVDAINSACKAMNVSVELASIRDLYPTYNWKDLAAHRGIVPLPCQPSMIGIIEQYRMNIPLFLPTKVLRHFTLLLILVVLSCISLKPIQNDAILSVRLSVTSRNLQR